MHITKTHQNLFATLLLAVAFLFAFFAVGTTAVHAEENSDTEESSQGDEKRGKK